MADLADNTCTVTIAAGPVAGMDDDSVALAVRPKLGQFNAWDVTRDGDKTVTVEFRHSPVNDPENDLSRKVR